MGGEKLGVSGGERGSLLGLGRAQRLLGGPNLRTSRTDVAGIVVPERQGNRSADDERGGRSFVEAAHSGAHGDIGHATGAFDFQRGALSFDHGGEPAQPGVARHGEGGLEASKRRGNLR